MIRLQLFSSRKLTDSSEPFRASLQWTEPKTIEYLITIEYQCLKETLRELASKNREILWARVGVQLMLQKVSY